MFQIGELTDSMGKHLLSLSPGSGKYQLITRLGFYEPGLSVQRNTLYFISSDALREIGSEVPGLSDCYLFVYGASESDSFPILPSVFLAVTDYHAGTLYNLVAEYLETRKNESEDEFSGFIRSVIDMEIVSEQQIGARYRLCAHNSQNPFHLVVFKSLSKSEGIPVLEVLRAQIFERYPFSDVALYDRHYVAMIHTDPKITDSHGLENYRNTEHEMEDFLSGVCEQHDLICCISYITKNISIIRTRYLQANGILRYFFYNRDPRGDRVASQYQYGLIFLVQICTEQFIAGNHPASYLYALEPAIGVIIRYDAEHNNNLRKTLMHYLLNNMSVTDTAKAMNMHRNTVQYKINQLKSMTMLHLDDDYKRCEYLWSCLMCEYCEKVLGKPPEQERSYAPSI